MATVTKNLRDAVITVLDGATSDLNGNAGANSFTVTLEEGDLTYTESREFYQCLDRGVLSHVRHGNDVSMTGSFSAMFSDMRLRHVFQSLAFPYSEALSGLSDGALNNNVSLAKTKVLGTATGESSYKKVSTEITPLQGQWREDSGNTIDIYTAAADTDFDIVYHVVGTSTTGIPLNLLNDSFEYGTLGSAPTSWSKLGNGDDSSTFVKSADYAKDGRYCAKTDVESTDTEMDITQTVTPSSVSVGNVYEFSIWLRSVTEDISSTISIEEHDAGGSNDSSSANYSVTAGAGWTWHRVRHTITDGASDRIVVKITNDGDLTSEILYMDKARLIQLDQSPLKTVDLQFVINDGTASPSAQDTVLLRDVHIESVEFSEGDPSTISFSFFSFAEDPIIT